MYRFWPNGCIQHIGVCETLVHYGHTVTHQTRIKEKLSLQEINAFNSQNADQRNISRAHPTDYKSNTDLRLNTHASN